MLSWLFLPYKGTGVSFSSRFMRWHGEMLLGRPEDVGAGSTLPAVCDSYYYLAVDRPVEEHKRNLKAWSRAQQRAEEARVVSKAEIPKATFLAVAVVSLLCAVATAAVTPRSSSWVEPTEITRGQAGIAQKAASLWKKAGGAAPLSGHAEGRSDDPKIRKACEEQWAAGRRADVASIRRCGAIWNEISQGGH